MDQLIELALKMPPIISAALALLMLFVVWRVGKKLFTELEGVGKKLDGIQSQTTKTNGSVVELKTWRTAHDKQDDERHEEMGRKHEENIGRFDIVFEKLDRIQAKGGV